MRLISSEFRIKFSKMNRINMLFDFREFYSIIFLNIKYKSNFLSIRNLLFLGSTPTGIVISNLILLHSVLLHVPNKGHQFNKIDPLNRAYRSEHVCARFPRDRVWEFGGNKDSIYVRSFCKHL